MKKIAIITTAFGFGLEDRGKTYAKLFAEHGFEPWYCTRDELLSSSVGVEGVIVGVEAADQTFFDACPSLRIAMKFGVGLDNFDKAYANARGVEIANMPGINSEAVGEMVFALMLSTSRRISTLDRSCKRGEFQQLCSNSILGKTLGIVGMGTIGKNVAQIARAFNMRCIGFDVQSLEVSGIERVDFDTLLAQSDIITIHIPLTAENRHLFGAREYSKMKSGAIILNTSRGGIIDEDALADAILDGHIGGAGVDVYESMSSVSRLCALDRVVCTPHVAAYTHETLRHMERTAIAKFAAFFGESLL
jgi:lactate dehydrogenase-like 2-hydroxyacid dehydrogenase